MKQPKNIQNVLVNSTAHNRGIRKIFELKVYLPDIRTLSQPLFTGTRRQIFCELYKYCSDGDHVSISRAFFSPFNFDPIYIRFCSNLDYFKDFLPFSYDYIPCFYIYKVGCKHNRCYFIAQEVVA